MTRHELCVQIKIRPETLYRMVVAGEVLFARDGSWLLYKTVNPSNTYAEGASPGDTRELAARQPPQLEHVGALAAFVDELSEALIRSEQALQTAQSTSKEALKRVRQTTDAHTALSERHDAVAQRLRGYEYALDRSHRALQRSNADSSRLRADLEQLLGEVEDLALSPLGMPVRRRLKAILARADGVLADTKGRPLPES
jgi:ATP phosphoribosyltransferase regulatory subunit HisZ